MNKKLVMFGALALIIASGQMVKTSNEPKEEYTKEEMIKLFEKDNEKKPNPDGIIFESLKYGREEFSNDTKELKKEWNDFDISAPEIARLRVTAKIIEGIHHKIKKEWVYKNSKYYVVRLASRDLNKKEKEKVGNELKAIRYAYLLLPELKNNYERHRDLAVQSTAERLKRVDEHLKKTFKNWADATRYGN